MFSFKRNNKRKRFVGSIKTTKMRETSQLKQFLFFSCPENFSLIIQFDPFKCITIIPTRVTLRCYDPDRTFLLNQQSPIL